MNEKTEAMTADQIDAIGNRLHSVSLGEWIKGFNIQLQCSTLACDGRNLFWAVHPDPMKSDRALEFITHARQDMRALLAEVARLRAENKRLERQVMQLAEAEQKRAREALIEAQITEGWFKSSQGGRHE